MHHRPSTGLNYVSVRGPGDNYERNVLPRKGQYRASMQTMEKGGIIVTCNFFRMYPISVELICLISPLALRCYVGRQPIVTSCLQPIAFGGAQSKKLVNIFGWGFKSRDVFINSPTSLQ